MLPIKVAFDPLLGLVGDKGVQEREGGSPWVVSRFPSTTWSVGTPDMTLYEVDGEGLEALIASATAAWKRRVGVPSSQVGARDSTFGPKPPSLP